MMPDSPTSHPAPRRPGLPGWAWALIGCGCSGPLLLIPILAAILFPVFAQAREKARAISCLSNVKQQGVALMMYAQDNDDRFPPADAWMDRIGPFLSGENDVRGGVLHCPSLAGPEGYGYAMNRRFAKKPVSKIASPESQIVLFESADLTRNASAEKVEIAARHLKKGNVAYADGHAKGMTAAP